MSFKILALSTATESCSVALLNNDKIYTRIQMNTAKKQNSNCIIILINEVLKITNCKLIDVDAIAVSIGPGNFTSIRIGISVVQGLALDRITKIVCISTLQILAYSALRNKNNIYGGVLTAINARIGEIYWGEYQLDQVNNLLSLKEDTAERVLSPNDAIERIKLLKNKIKWLPAGNSWNTYPCLCYDEGHNLSLNGSSIVEIPLAEDMIPIAKIALQKGDFVKPENIQAVYLRNNIVHKK
ncbi:tRNA (adenosine(37)-N6)-threonylcarbamoyltransferase complex dimerization subunit type 1 TsaB [Pantoea sp. SoEX]|uniref:tRNA (adenosine(37)-N6)-threonylcarbamoyltransferase complex dimerization subunit type 1 TsaB n=1 Tax=Pantoea sp. SoEX TaxID=2576763 RepID=UPI001357BA84|nr:tRNA (adenosine(37)-N6)-threonylcarbamoyltransferase complex dimerization subunit type 1 TsaB [Pantoea sp. SoEX]MXP50924.1 tRNA (adenosine(37)-N6)-threonylcarbamoyltransferase complex dimerization subunit type 1 TsaB [Pantoea sp. SoEX]